MRHEHETQIAANPTLRRLAGQRGRTARLALNSLLDVPYFSLYR